MKARIEVSDKSEASLIEAALSDPVTRAMVKIIGALLPLPVHARRRILTHIANQMADDGQEKREAAGGATS